MTAERVGSAALQAMFNEHIRPHLESFLEIIESSKPVVDGHHEPPGTLSQMVRYEHDDRQLVAIVHRYIRPDGSFGASGTPDPKRIRLANGDVYWC